MIYLPYPQSSFVFSNVVKTFSKSFFSPLRPPNLFEIFQDSLLFNFLISLTNLLSFSPFFLPLHSTALACTCSRWAAT